MTAPRSLNRSDAPPPARLKGRGTALLLDLSEDEQAALDWAARELSGSRITVIHKSDLRWGSKRQALARLRASAPDLFAVFATDLQAQSARGAIIIYASLIAPRVIMGDRAGRAIKRSRLGALMIEAPRFAIEVALGYAAIIPLTWLLTCSLRASIWLKPIIRASRDARSGEGIQKNSATVLYVRATMTNAREGGMATHVAGFLRGAAALGHRPVLVLSAPSPQTGQERDTLRRYLINPSAALGATKALFEIWNNLVFTARSLRLVSGQAMLGREIDFIYQRYSVFNWTGVALSAITGIPLALEFNGSEVWVSKNWNPIGQVWLLRRFERLNQLGADLIFVVSEVERRNLIAAGLAESRIVVNPNGVDVDEFHPDSGGAETRRSLGISDRVVVGFLGTFGPWHGAQVLAEAATRVSEESGCHFLFIGDGEQRPKAEALARPLIEKGRATFTGRITHDRVAAYLDACDILVSPHVPSADGSEFFGSPTKLFEYLAMARPVVASRLGQIADIISDGSNGILVEPGNPEALAKAVERLARDRELRARLGREARKTVAGGYTWRHNAARVFEKMGAG